MALALDFWLVLGATTLTLPQFKPFFPRSSILFARTETFILEEMFTSDAACCLFFGYFIFAWVPIMNFICIGKLRHFLPTQSHTFETIVVENLLWTEWHWPRYMDFNWHLNAHFVIHLLWIFVFFYRSFVYIPKCVFMID